MTYTDITTNSEESEKSPMGGVECLRLSLKNANNQVNLTSELLDRLIFSLENEHQACLVTIEGTPGSFCKGMNIEELAVQQSNNAQAELPRLLKLLNIIERTPRPVIALVDGPALGGGVGIACAADLVLASPKASFSLPETVIGMIPAVVFPYIVRRIGVAKARLLALGYQRISASTALEWGLVDEIVDDFEISLKRYIRRFSRMEPRALGIIKTLVADHFGAPPNYYQNATSHQYNLLSTQETRGRLTRFAMGGLPWVEENKE